MMLNFLLLLSRWSSELDLQMELSRPEDKTLRLSVLSRFYFVRLLSQEPV